MSHLGQQLEAILFVASEPVNLDRLAEATATSQQDVRAALDELSTTLAMRGVQLTHHNDAYRLVTAPVTSEVVRRFLTEASNSELSRPALETLAIVAYRGPLTKSSVDELRGVSSEAMLRNLMQRGLIAEHGTAPEPGHPTLYAVSQTFLEEFGLASLNQLPPLDEAAEE